MLKSDVAHGREVEIHLLVDVLDIIVLNQLLDLPPVLITAAIIDQNHLDVRVCGMCSEGFNTLCHTLQVIL